MKFRLVVGTLALGAGIALAAPASAQFVADLGTVSLWHFDDGSGTVADDAQVLDFDLGLARYPADGSTGATLPAWTSDGCFGNALDFAKGNADGNGGLASNTASFDFGLSQVSVELWLRTTSDNGILFWGGFIQLQLWLDFDGKVRFYTGNGSSWSDPAITNVAVNDGEWHYVAATYDDTTLRLYLDGALRDSVEWAGTLGTMNGFLVGGRGQNTFFEGTLDEVRLSQVARSPDQVTDHWASRPCPEPAAAGAAAAAAAALTELCRRRAA